MLGRREFLLGSSAILVASGSVSRASSGKIDWNELAIYGEAGVRALIDGLSFVNPYAMAFKVLLNTYDNVVAYKQRIAQEQQLDRIEAAFADVQGSFDRLIRQFDTSRRQLEAIQSSLIDVNARLQAIEAGVVTLGEAVNYLIRYLDSATVAMRALRGHWKTFSQLRREYRAAATLGKSTSAAQEKLDGLLGKVVDVRNGMDDSGATSIELVSTWMFSVQLEVTISNLLNKNVNSIEQTCAANSEYQDWIENRLDRSRKNVNGLTKRHEIAERRVDEIANEIEALIRDQPLVQVFNSPFPTRSSGLDKRVDLHCVYGVGDNSGMISPPRTVAAYRKISALIKRSKIKVDLEDWEDSSEAKFNEFYYLSLSIEKSGKRREVAQLKSAIIDPYSTLLGAPSPACKADDSISSISDVDAMLSRPVPGSVVEKVRTIAVQIERFNVALCEVISCRQMIYLLNKQRNVALRGLC